MSRASRRRRVSVSGPGRWPFGALALAGAVALERLVELAWSRKHVERLGRRGGRVVEEPLFSAMVALHAAVLVAAPLEAALRLRRAPRSRALGGPRLRTLALSALGLASLLRGWTLATLGDAWSVRVMRFEGRARPIVRSGPYRFIRHPNYLALIVELCAWPLASGAIVTAALASLGNALLLARRIPLEERELFADPRYRAQMGSRPRFFPRLFSRPRS